MYLVADTETGAIEPENGSLLTACFYVCDGKFNVVEKLSIALKSDPYVVGAGALKVNKINIADHDERAVSKETATELITRLLEKYTVNPKTKEFRQMTIVGHNIQFDIKWLHHHLPSVPWKKFVSYRVICTQIVSQFLQMQRKIPYGKSSLTSLTEHFKLPHDAHDAEGDVIACIEVMKKMREL